MFLLVSLKVMTKIAESGSIRQRDGPADPDPYQYVPDPQFTDNSILVSTKAIQLSTGTV